MNRHAWLLRLVVSAFVWSIAPWSFGSELAPAPGRALDRVLTLRVMAYNIHHGEGTDKKLDLERIGKVIASVKPDLVALQEVDVRTKRTQNTDQAKLLAAQLDMHVVFGKAIDYQGGAYGLAILSRFPVAEHEMILLPPEKQQEQRGVLVATIKFPATERNGKERALRFACTHLSVAGEIERLPQVQEINRIFCLDQVANDPPTILAGDFNAGPQSEPIEEILQYWQDSFIGDPAARRIDYIFYRNTDAFRGRNFKRMDEPVASDHHPIYVELELAP